MPVLLYCTSEGQRPSQRRQVRSDLSSAQETRSDGPSGLVEVDAYVDV